MSFFETDIRVGTIVQVEDFPEARKKAYKLVIDFGEEIGIKRSSAQITENYTKDTLLGKKIIAVINLPPRQIGPYISEVLVLGAYDTSESVRLLEIQGEVLNGSKIC